MKKAEIIARLKGVAETRLEKRVLNIILKECGNFNQGTFEERLERVLKDFSHGCSTGIVSSLIAYHQTNRFFNTYRAEILELLQDDIYEGLFEIKEGYNEYNWMPENYISFNCSNAKINIDYNNRLKGKKYDMQQKNVLAWYGFEKCLFKFMNEMEL